MKFKIIKIGNMSGTKASIYSVVIEDETSSLFKKFIHENNQTYPKEVENLLDKLAIMAHKTGAPDYYFKEWEGNVGDQICVLKDLPAKKLRLYCIRLGNCTLILGGGGPKNVKALQDDEKLKTENYLLRNISCLVGERLKEREIIIDESTNDLLGNLVFDDEDNE